MMSDISVLLLDAIRFLKFSNDPIKYQLATQVKEHAEEEFKDKSEHDEVCSLYYKILCDVLNGDLDITGGNGDASYAILKYKNHQGAKNNPEAVDKLKDILVATDEQSTKKVNNIQRRIKNHLVWAKGNKTIKQLNKQNWKVQATEDEEAQDELLNSVLQHAKDLVKVHETSVGGSSADKSVDFIDMSSEDSIRKAIEKHKEKRMKQKFKTGLHGLNEMLEGGLDKGEFAGFAALSHHYKSGFLMNLARWICVHNSPGVPPDFIPTVVFISFENEIYENTMEWFRSAYQNTFHTKPEDLTDEQIVEYVTEVYSRKGFRLLVFRRIGAEFGMDEYEALMQELEEAGHYVVASLLDYMQLMKLPEVGDNNAKRFQNLASRMRDHSNHNGILTATGLQLHGEAEQIANSGQTYVVKRFNGGHLADCKAVKRELDLLLFLHIEKNHNDVPFLTIKWDKRRYYNPPQKKFVAYPFTATGIMDDIGGEDQSVNDIYAEDSSAGEATDLDEEITI